MALKKKISEQAQHIASCTQFTQQQRYVNTANAIAQTYLIRRKAESNQQCQYRQTGENTSTLARSKTRDFFFFCKLQKFFLWFLLRHKNLLILCPVQLDRSKVFSLVASKEGHIYAFVA